MATPNRFFLFFKNIAYFLSSRLFIKNFFYMVGGALLFFVLLFWWILPSYTRHSESIEVSDIRNLTVEQAQKMVKSRRLRLVVTDSIYEPKKTAGLILEQIPKAGARVKPNRTIYVTVNTATAPLVNVYYKQIVGRHLTYIERKFKSLDIKIGSLKYISGKAENTVAKAFIDDRILFIEANPSRGEKPPTEPQRIPRGAIIDLELYRGEDAELKQIPKLQCLTYEQALFTIKGNEYHIGNVKLDNTVGSDTTAAYVWRQSPPPGSRASMGSGIDIWLTKDLPEACADAEEED